MSLPFFLNSFYTTNTPAEIPAAQRDYTQEDLLALVRESQPRTPTPQLGEVFAEPAEQLQCLRLAAENLPACAKTFSRLKTGYWFG